MKVILATDGSEHAKEAARLLARLPHRDHLEIEVLFVGTADHLLGSNLPTDSLRLLRETDHVRAQSVFEEIKSLFDSANASLKLVFIEGRPSQSILHYVKQANCDLLLLGAVGHSFLERMLGSVSDSVATNSHCSVLIVRPTSPSQSKSPIRLCVAYDESPASRATIEQLETFRWGVNSSIDVLGVYLMPFAYSDIPIAIDLDQLKVSKERVVEEASKELTRLSPNVHSHVIEAGHAGDAIVDFAKTHASDIIVLGNENNDLLDRFLMGSTSRYVLRHAKCSVWICRKGKQ